MIEWMINHCVHYLGFHTAVLKSVASFGWRAQCGLALLRRGVKATFDSLWSLSRLSTRQPSALPLPSIAALSFFLSLPWLTGWSIWGVRGQSPHSRTWTLALLLLPNCQLPWLSKKTFGTRCTFQKYLLGHPVLEEATAAVTLIRPSPPSPFLLQFGD